MKPRIIIILGCISLFGGCTDWDTSSVSTSETVNQENAFSAQNVRLTAGAFDPNKYSRVTDLKVSVNKTTVFNPDPDVQAVEAKLKEEAYKVGATDVFEVRITDVGISLWSYGTRKGFGVAAKPK
ncbi:hypothetical protein [Neptunicoccus cionae]|uniref:hypothetical protein n=1 Tax=Neptunicoccus cionae TaxID=2035344 RepID=UPI000C769661|nr:hypothetical protein [Amylibacter cionae]PLS20710.1 hypothetical protein C0U40_16440 [Amylibacter cionae]